MKAKVKTITVEELKRRVATETFDCSDIHCNNCIFHIVYNSNGQKMSECGGQIDYVNWIGLIKWLSKRRDTTLITITKIKQFLIKNIVNYEKYDIN